MKTANKKDPDLKLLTEMIETYLNDNQCLSEKDEGLGFAVLVFDPDDTWLQLASNAKTEFVMHYMKIAIKRLETNENTKMETFILRGN